MAPIGVEALKIARCLLQFGRGREVASRDVVSAKDVGATYEKEFDNEQRLPQI